MATDDDSQSGISIEVSGPPDCGKSLVCGIIHNALTKSGFTNVSITDQQGELVDPSDNKTLLDLVQQAAPELFTMPVGITEVTDVVSDDNVIELSDVTLRVDAADDVLSEELLAPEEILAEEDS
jgi:hypothetical protein